MSKNGKKQAIFASGPVAQSIIPLDVSQFIRWVIMSAEHRIASVTEFNHISEMQEDLRRKLEESKRKDIGRMDSLRSSVLGLVVSENYERACEEMVAYVDLKTSFPAFQHRVERVVQHCSELIQAIETKRNFPGLAALSLAKQQEIHEKVLEHFEELKQHLRQIEKIEREFKLDDVRSTVWVVRSIVHGLTAIFLVGLMVDIRNGVFNSAWAITSLYLDGFAAWLVNLIHF